jgi:phage-related protein
MNEELKVIISANVEKFKNNVNDAKKKIKDFVKEGTEDFSAMNDEFQKVGDAAKNGLKVAAGAIAGVTAALFAAGESTKEYRQSMAKLASSFEATGKSADGAKATYNELFRIIGDSDVAVEAAQQISLFAKSEEEAAKWAGLASGVVATFGDALTPETFYEAANETLSLGEATGAYTQMLEQAHMDVEEFNAKLAACNTEAERQALVFEVANGVVGAAGAAYEKNNAALIAQNEAQAKMTEAMAKLGEVTTPIMTMLTELGAKILADLTPYIQEFAEKHLPSIKEALSGVGEAIGKVISWVADNWELVSTLAVVIGAISAALAVFSTVMGIVNAVMMASPVTWIVLAIVAAIAALVAIIVLVIKHWDEIQAATKKCWDAIVNAVKAAIDWVVNLFQSIINWVKENWQGLLLLLVNPFAGAFKLLYDNCDGFREFIDNFLDKIKSGIKAGFDWIKEKMINPIKDAFSSVKQTFSNIVSTISEKLGAAKNKVKGIIDSIKGFFDFEFKWPSMTMPKFTISPSGWKAADLLKGTIPKLSIKWNALGGVFDKPTLFGYGNSLQGIGENGAEAVVPLENNLGWLDKMAGMLAEKLGSGSTVVLQVDGRTFGQISVDSINGITRQTGSLPLVFA